MAEQEDNHRVSNKELRSARILIMDDDPDINQFLTAFLGREGCQCSSLTDPSKIEPWLALNECDMVILDISMPKADGLSLLSVIRAKHPNLPIVIFTGLGYDEEKMQTALRGGANGYVSKGLPPEEIFLALSRVWRQHHHGHSV